MSFLVPNHGLLSSLRFEMKEAKTQACELGRIGFAMDLLDLNKDISLRLQVNSGDIYHMIDSI